MLIKGRRKATLRARGLGGAPGSLPSAVVDLLCAVIRVQGAGVWQGRTRVQVRALSRLRWTAAETTSGETAAAAEAAAVC